MLLIFVCFRAAKLIAGSDCYKRSALSQYRSTQTLWLPGAPLAPFDCQPERLDAKRRSAHNDGAGNASFCIANDSSPDGPLAVVERM